jgi:hypothetical protein
MLKHKGMLSSGLSAITVILLTASIARGIDIAGQTTDDNAKPLQAVIVSAKESKDASAFSIATVASDASGNFVLTLDSQKTTIFLFYSKPAYTCNFSPQALPIRGTNVTALPVSLHSTETSFASLDFGPILDLRAKSSPSPIKQIGRDINALAASPQVQESAITSAAKTVLVKMALTTENPKKSLDSDFETLSDLNVKKVMINDVRAAAYQEISKDKPLPPSP